MNLNNTYTNLLLALDLVVDVFPSIYNTSFIKTRMRIIVGIYIRVLYL